MQTKWQSLGPTLRPPAPTALGSAKSVGQIWPLQAHRGFQKTVRSEEEDRIAPSRQRPATIQLLLGEEPTREVQARPKCCQEAGQLQEGVRNCWLSGTQKGQAQPQVPKPHSQTSPIARSMELRAGQATGGARERKRSQGSGWGGAWRTTGGGSYGSYGSELRYSPNLYHEQTIGQSSSQGFVPSESPGTDHG